MKLFDGLVHLLAHVLDVEVDPVQHGALVNDERTEILEQLGQLGDALCDLIDLSISLRYIRICLYGCSLFFKKELRLLLLQVLIRFG